MLRKQKTNALLYETFRWLVVPVLLILGISLTRASEAQTQPGAQASEVNKFFQQYAGLNAEEVKSIHAGNPVAKVLKSPGEQVLVFGVVYIKAEPESYITFASNIEETAKLPGYLAIRKFSDPPQLSDLDNFTLEPDDIKDLEKCKSDHCEVQLPAENMEEFQKSINWKAANVADSVNHLAREMALRALQSYIQGGNSALGTYRDKKDPNAVSETFQSLLNRSKSLPVYMPDLHRYLLEYPTFKPTDIQSEFHWEKVKFGLKPTIRIIQRIIYKDAGTESYALAEKQLYSSHYFQSALDITAAVKDKSQPDDHGFYLITAKGSQQAGLTGLKGGIVRNVATDKTRSSLEQGLKMIKQKLETGAAK